MTISRRDFVFKSASLLAGAAVAPVRLRFPRSAQQSKRVLVIGAGAAGLCTAYELDRAGHDVLVFEAKMIPGGRIHTVRAPFADGLYAEAGAMSVPDGHNLTMHYLREFHLPLTTQGAQGGLVVHVAGRRIVVRRGQELTWPVPLNEDERGQSIRQLVNRYWYSHLAEMGLDASDWPYPSHLEYDRVALADYWRSRGASEGAVHLMSLPGLTGGLGEGPQSYSALMRMHEFAASATSRSYYLIEGGNDLLPRAFAERLGSKIRYGSPAVAVRQEEGAAQVTIEDRSGRHEVTGDYVVCTLPFAVLRHLNFTPALPAKRQRALREIESTSVTRVYLQCRERFWEAEGLSGMAFTDLPIMSVFHPTQGQPGPRGILESYSAGAHARRFAVMNPNERLDAVARDLTKLFPKLPQYLEGGYSVSWDNDPWALGDYAYFKPGQIEAFFPYIQKPEGRIYFAGDHIGGLPGWIQGALLSGQRAAEEIGALG